MRAHLFLLSSIIAVFSFTSKAQNWQWAQAESQINTERGGVAVDSQGNVYQAGGTLSSGVLQGTLVVPTGPTPNGIGGFLTKRDAQGNTLWVKHFPALQIVDISVNGSGEIVAVASYSNNLVLGTQSISAQGTVNFLLVKFDASGNYLWHQKIFMSLLGSIYALDVDKTTNNIFIALSSVGGTVSIGQSTLNLLFNASAYQASGVIKFDTNGNYLWHYFANDLNPTLPRDLAVDGNGDCVLVGFYNGQLLFSNNTSLVSNGAADGFAIKISSSGNLVWKKGFGGTGGEQVFTVHFDSSNNCYFGGYFSSTNLVLANTSLSCPVGSDSYILKCDANGNEIWVKQFGNFQSTEYTIDGVSYAGGSYYALYVNGSSLSLGPNTYSLNPAEGYMALLQLDNNGNVLSSTIIRNTGYALACFNNLLDLDGKCGLYFASCMICFQSATLGPFVLSTGATAAAFIGHLNAAINQPTLTIAGANSVCIGSQLTLQAGGASSYTWSTGANSNSISITINSNTFVTLSGTSAGLNCPVQVVKAITAVSPPALSLSASNTLVCEGTPVVLVATGAQTYTWNTGSNSFSVAVTPTANSNYTVSASNANCSSTQSVHIQTKVSPALQISSSPSVFCAGEALQISASGANTYTWANGSNAANFVMASANNTVLSVSGTNTLTGCTSTLTSMLSVSACTGIEKFSATEHVFLAYPNPTSDIITLMSREAMRIEVHNMIGAKINTIELNAEEPLLLDVSGFPSGCYLLRGSESSQIIKFTVQR